MFKTLFAVAAIAQVASAHFRLYYPTWRGDSFATGNSQWFYPCAGINATADANNRTVWPLDGGPVVLNSSHPFVYVFINLGLGPNPTNFNYSLTPDLVNVTGPGQLYLPKLKIPANANITDGQLASIQVVTTSESGNALYNCADIKFSTNATVPSPSQYPNATGIQVSVLSGNGATRTTSGNGSSTNSSSSASHSATPGAGSILGFNPAALVVPAAGALAMALL